MLVVLDPIRFFSERHRQRRGWSHRYLERGLLRLRQAVLRDDGHPLPLARQLVAKSLRSTAQSSICIVSRFILRQPLSFEFTGSTLLNAGKRRVQELGKKRGIAHDGNEPVSEHQPYRSKALSYLQQLKVAAHSTRIHPIATTVGFEITVAAAPTPATSRPLQPCHILRSQSRAQRQ